MAVICVLLTTTTFDCDALPPSLRVVCGVKLDPVNVTFTDEPCTPVLGAIEDRTGTKLLVLTVNGTVLLVPPGVVTDKL